MRLFSRMIRCNGCRNLILVFVVLAVLNLSFMIYSMFSLNAKSALEEDRHYPFPDSDKWLIARETVLGKGVESILHRLSHGPETPVFLFKPVCRSTVCAKHSGVELRRIFKQNGFEIVNKSDKEWTVSFTNGVSGVPKVTKIWQYTNIVPGIGKLCFREKLCLRLKELYFLNKVFASFPPCIHIHKNESLEMQLRDIPPDYWLVKREGTLRGASTGITIVHTNNIIDKLKEKFSVTPEMSSDTKSLYQTRSHTTIEKYIHEPFIVKRRKHLLQLYLLVKSIDPLRVYVSDFGYVTFAQLPYKFDKDFDGGNSSCMHLDIYTSSFCTKMYHIPPAAWELNGKNSLIWTLDHYWTELLNMNIDVEHITAQIHDALLQTAILMASTSSDMINTNYQHERPRFSALMKNGFALFHVKVVLDKNRKAHIVDIDCDPGLHNLGGDSFRSSQMTLLIQDLIKLSGSFREKYDRQSYHEKLFDNLMSFCGNRGGCTEEEIRTIVVFEDERHNSGHFQVIYPHPKTVNVYKATVKELHFDSILNEYIEQIRKF